MNIKENKENAIVFYKMAYEGNPGKAIELYMGSEYNQYNPSFILKMKNIILILLNLFILLSLSCQDRNTNEAIQFKEIRRPYKTISPYISDLLKLDDNSLKTEVQKIWISAKQSGLPLIEEDTLYADYRYITIIYQNSAKHKDISFEVFGIYDDYSFGDMKLRQLGNTDLFYRCYKVPNDICFSYRFIIKDILTGKVSKDIDKYNPDKIPIGEVYGFSYSVFDLRKNEPDWNAKRYNNLNSRMDTLLYEDKIVNKRRNIYVYLPPDYDNDRPEAYPVIFLFDASIYLNRVEVPNILDNLIIEGEIEPMIAVLIESYRSTRDIILPLNFEFKDEFITDFLPLIRNNYNTSLKPEFNIIGGISYGGLAATFIAFYYPDIFGKILSQSGSFWRDLQLTDLQDKWIRNDWLINRFITEENKNLQLYFDWGLQENWVLGANRKMVHVLEQKGYKYKFIEFNGWHDWSNSRKTFPQGLMYLLEE